MSLISLGTWLHSVTLGYTPGYTLFPFKINEVTLVTLKRGRAYTGKTYLHANEKTLARTELLQMSVTSVTSLICNGNNRNPRP
jgi:hypothetical protein